MGDLIKNVETIVRACVLLNILFVSSKICGEYYFELKSVKCGSCGIGGTTDVVRGDERSENTEFYVRTYLFPCL